VLTKRKQNAVQKEVVKDVRWEGIHFSLAIERPAVGIVVVRFSGWDAGEFGDAPMRELAKDLLNETRVELFVDAREVKGASIEVSGDWSQWLGKHRASFKHITMLTGSRFIQVTANFVRRYGELGELMRIYTEPAAFDEAVEESIARVRGVRSEPNQPGCA
jgi:hypothetical protein